MELEYRDKIIINFIKAYFG